MRTLRAAFARFLGLFNHADRDADFAAELESHLQLHIDDNLRAGMPPAEARRQALLQLGGVASTREAYRDRGGVPWLEHFLRDLRFAARQLRRQPGFALTAIFVLAVGLAASLAIFSFVDAALVRPLPYPNPDRLMSVMGKTTAFPRSKSLLPRLPRLAPAEHRLRIAGSLHRRRLSAAHPQRHRTGNRRPRLGRLLPGARYSPTPGPGLH